MLLFFHWKQQHYLGYNTDALSSAGITAKGTAFETLGEEWNKELSKAMGDSYFTSANIWSVNQFLFTYKIFCVIII